MQKTISITTVAVLAALGASAQAQDLTGRVISSTPVVQQVQVPRTVCSNQPIAVQQPRSGAGAVIGAIAGAALGNAIGAGAGRAVATGVGLIGGAAVGDRIEGGGVVYQNGQQCSTQTFYENRTVGYNVTYEFGGRQYTMQMPNDPGPTVRLQVSPVGAYGPTSEIVSVPGVVASTTTMYPAYQTYPAYPAYAAYPAYYSAYPYYSPVGISLGFGFGGGWGGHRHGGHWR